MVATSRIGVLAIQGDFAAHIKALGALGREAVEVRTARDLDGLDLVVLPGGESGAQLRILRESGLDDDLKRFHEQGGALFGTCAGLILLARTVTNPVQDSLGLLDIEVVRNGFGRQVDSFEAVADPTTGFSEPVGLVFIRAPRIQSVSPAVDVILRFQDEPVAVQAGRILAATFHPEMSGDLAFHEHLLDRVLSGVPARA